MKGASHLQGSLTVHVGPASQPLEIWSLAGLSAADTGLRLRLPVPVHSVVIRADEVAKRRLSQVSLVPEHIEPKGSRLPAYALRAARFGRTQAFALDDNVFLEPEGLWTRGNSVTRIWIGGDEATSVEIAMQAGAVDAVVELSEGE